MNQSFTLSQLFVKPMPVDSSANRQDVTKYLVAIMILFSQLFFLQLFEQGLNNASGDTKRSYRITPPDPLRSLSFQPKYPTFNTGDGYCARTELTGCVSTIQEGELVTEGKYKKDL